MRILRSAGKRFGVAAIGLTIMAVFAGGTAAEEAQCQWQAPLLNLTNLVLTQRKDLPQLQARNFGAEAAYLQIRYGHLDELAIVTMLDQMVGDEVLQAADLRLAWYLATFGEDATIGKLGHDAFDILGTWSNLSAIRAMMSAGGETRLLQRISELPAEEQVELTRAIITAVIDAPDGYKEQLVAKALQLNLVSLAVGLTASTQNRRSWKTFAASVPLDKAFRVAANKWHWLPAVMGNAVLPDPEPIVDAERQTRRANLQDVTIAGAMTPEIDLLLNYLNQGVDTDSSLIVANDFRRAIEMGTVPVKGSLDAAWLFLFRDLSSQVGAARVRDVVGDLSVNNGRYGIERAGDLLDRIIAVDALTPYLSGASATLPDLPADLSADFVAQWPHWVALAQLVKADPNLSSSADDLDIVAELLFGGGHMDPLAALLDTAEPSLETITTAGDFARRLDRLCNSYLWHQGESLMLAGQPIFKFD